MPVVVKSHRRELAEIGLGIGVEIDAVDVDAMAVDEAVALLSELVAQPSLLGQEQGAQALMALMNSGVGNLIGYLGVGWWFAECARPAGTQWSHFWSGLAAAFDDTTRPMAVAIGLFGLLAFVAEKYSFRTTGHG